jgi:hypothetical protein
MDHGWFVCGLKLDDVTHSVTVTGFLTPARL